MNTPEFKRELIAAAWKHVKWACESDVDENNQEVGYPEWMAFPEYKPNYPGTLPYWTWIKHREICFPNEIGCSKECGCLGGYSGVNCREDWAVNQITHAEDCDCEFIYDDDGIDIISVIPCTCDLPYRRGCETSQDALRKRDPESFDFKFFNSIYLTHILTNIMKKKLL